MTREEFDNLVVGDRVYRVTFVDGCKMASCRVVDKWRNGCSIANWPYPHIHSGNCKDFHLTRKQARDHAIQKQKMACDAARARMAAAIDLYVEDESQ